jgi:hypothetical protein
MGFREAGAIIKLPHERTPVSFLSSQILALITKIEANTGARIQLSKPLGPTTLRTRAHTCTTSGALYLLQREIIALDLWCREGESNPQGPLV